MSTQVLPIIDLRPIALHLELEKSSLKLTMRLGVGVKWLQELAGPHQHIVSIMAELRSQTLPGGPCGS